MLSNLTFGGIQYYIFLIVEKFNEKNWKVSKGDNITRDNAHKGGPHY
jgi:hypothetical protein